MGKHRDLWVSWHFLKMLLVFTLIYSKIYRQRPSVRRLVMTILSFTVPLNDVSKRCKPCIDVSCAWTTKSPSWTASYCCTTWINYMWLLYANVKCYWIIFCFTQLYFYVWITSWDSGKNMVCCKLNVNCWVICQLTSCRCWQLMLC